MTALGRTLCLFMIFAAVRGMAVGSKKENDSKSIKNSEDDDYEEESSIEELDDIQPLSEGAGSIWNQMFSGNHSHLGSTLLPKTVYDFQTGELSYFNGDLNSSSTDDHSIREDVPDYYTNSTEERPRRYSSKYLKQNPEEGEETSHDGVYATLEDKEKSENANEKSEDEKEPLKTESTHEHKKKGGNKKHSEGKGEEHHSDHHKVDGSKGHKDYKGEHHHHKGEKGHHDKESHKGQYSDKKGSKKAHKEGGGHFEAGVNGEKGHKDSEHKDKEEYKKGHSTRGGHVVHKKDEYEKKHEFYDEHHEGGEGEKHGEYHEEHHAKSGGHKKGGHKHGGSAHDHKGKKGHYDKGKKYHEEKGHKKAGGEEKKHEHDEKYGKKEGHSNWKKYDYDSGKGKGGGGGGGGHKKKGHYEEAGDGSHGHLRAVIYHDPAIKPQLIDQSRQEESSHSQQVQLAAAAAHLADAVAAENANPPVPATELRPPPIHQPKVIIKQFRFPPVALR